MLSRRNFLFGLAMAPVVVAPVAKATEWSQPVLKSASMPNFAHDGEVVVFRTGGTQQGTISIAPSTVIYGTFVGSHWDRTLHCG